jgi:adenosylhomocysteinase
VEALRRDYKSDCLVDDVERFLDPDGGSLYLVRSGHPVNFADGAVLGPVLTLVQAELIAALGLVVDLASRDLRGLRELDHDARSMIASVWLECFNR